MNARTGGNAFRGRLLATIATLTAIVVAIAVAALAGLFAAVEEAALATASPVSATDREVIEDDVRIVGEDDRRREEIEVPSTLVLHSPSFARPDGPELVVRLLLEDGLTPVPQCRIGVLRETMVNDRWGNAEVTRVILAEQQTDGEGLARFGGVAAGKYVIAAGPSGEQRGILDFVRVDDRQPRAEFELRVRGTCDLVGRVVDEQELGVADVVVTFAEGAEVRTDEWGRYEFMGVCVGYVPSVRVEFDRAVASDDAPFPMEDRRVQLAFGRVEVETVVHDRLQGVATIFPKSRRRYGR